MTREEQWLAAIGDLEYLRFEKQKVAQTIRGDAILYYVGMGTWWFLFAVLSYFAWTSIDRGHWWVGGSAWVVMVAVAAIGKNFRLEYRTDQKQWIDLQHAVDVRIVEAEKYLGRVRECVDVGGQHEG